jgi:uncharacterized protein
MSRTLTTRRALLAPATESGLRYATLGRTGLKVTKLVFGSINTSDQMVIEQAVDMGINYFSTARDYQDGHNERLLGNGLKGRRQKVYVATESIDIELKGRIPREQETVEWLLTNLDTSLKELQTDYVDVWLFHNKSNPAHITAEMLEAARKAKQQGKVRFTGLTTHRLAQIADVVVKSEQMDVVMPIFNFTQGQTMDPALKQLREAGVGIVAMKVLAGGLREKTTQPQYSRPGALMAALKWAMYHPYVDVAIASINNIDQLQEDFRCMAAPPSREDLQLLAAALRRVGPEYCRNCGACDGACRENLPVADVHRFLTYAEGYGQFSMGLEKYRSLGPDVAAAKCGECEGCTVRCPFGVHVPERMERARTLFA